MAPSETAALIEAFLSNSPFARQLGLQLTALEADYCQLTLPFDPSLATYGQVIHGGATAALADTAATVAAISNPQAQLAGGATADLTLHYLRAAEGQDLLAAARVLRRGRSLCTIEVEVQTAEPRQLVAKALVTYKLRTVRGDGGG